MSDLIKKNNANDDLEIKPIPRFDNRYWIVEDGSYIVDYGRGGKIHYLHYVDDSGYITVNLHNKQYKRKNRTYRVHELVAEAFLGERPPWQVIDHIDRNKLNNHFKNLRYVSQKTNTRNSVNRGRVAVSLIKGDKVWNFDSMTEAKKFLMAATGKSSRHLTGKINLRCKEFHGFKAIYADEVPELRPTSRQKFIQLSLFKETDL